MVTLFSGEMEVLETVGTSTSVPGTGAGTEVLEAPGCEHQWMIESPNGPSSNGVCRICGEEKQFMNYIEGSAWGYGTYVEQMGGSRVPTRSDMQGGGSVDGDE